MPYQYFVYLLASPSRHLYVGITNDLHRRLAEHRMGLDPNAWTQRHGATRLVYFECTSDPRAAIQREKQLKVLTRVKKIALVERVNPDWRDLGEGLSNF